MCKMNKNILRAYFFSSNYYLQSGAFVNDCVWDICQSYTVSEVKESHRVFQPEVEGTLPLRSPKISNYRINVQ